MSDQTVTPCLRLSRDAYFTKPDSSMRRRGNLAKFNDGPLPVNSFGKKDEPAYGADNL